MKSSRPQDADIGNTSSQSLPYSQKKKEKTKIYKSKKSSPILTKRDIKGVSNLMLLHYTHKISILIPLDSTLPPWPSVDDSFLDQKYLVKILTEIPPPKLCPSVSNGIIRSECL